MNFQNSDLYSSIKEFTLSLKSILSEREDIKTNLATFSSLEDYDEKDWRDNDSEYFI